MIVKMEEIIRRENSLIRSFGGVLSIPEANGDLNDLQREKISAVYEDLGKAYIGKINFHGAERKSLTPDTVFVEYTGQMVCNFDADFVVPNADNHLAEMIIQWNNDSSKAALVGRMQKMIEKIGGVNLIWS